MRLDLSDLLEDKVQTTRTYWHCKRLDNGYNEPDKIIPVEKGLANLVGSQLQTPDGELLHAPVIDVDFPCRVIPSSTDGHYHLYIDKPMDWKQYQKFLKAMYEAGIIEKGYYNSAMKTKQSLVRKPGAYKEQSVEIEPLIKIRMEELRDIMIDLVKGFK